MSNPDIPLPKDPRHQRFADLHAFHGRCIADAYIQAGYKVRRSSATCNGRRLLRRPDVIAYLAAIRQAAATDTTLTLREILEFCARVVRVPITALHPNTEQDADLIKNYSLNEGEMGSTLRIEKHDPFKAIDTHLKLTNEDPETNALKDLAAAIGKLGGASVLPTDKM